MATKRRCIFFTFQTQTREQNDSYFTQHLILMTAAGIFGWMVDSDPLFPLVWLTVRVCVCAERRSNRVPCEKCMSLGK